MRSALIRYSLLAALSPSLYVIFLGYAKAVSPRNFGRWLWKFGVRGQQYASVGTYFGALAGATWVSLQATALEHQRYEVDYATAWPVVATTAGMGALLGAFTAAWFEIAANLRSGCKLCRKRSWCTEHKKVMAVTVVVHLLVFPLFVLRVE